MCTSPVFVQDLSASSNFGPYLARASNGDGSLAVGSPYNTRKLHPNCLDIGTGTSPAGDRQRYWGICLRRLGYPIRGPFVSRALCSLVSGFTQSFGSLNGLHEPNEVVQYGGAPVTCARTIYTKTSRERDMKQNYRRGYHELEAQPTTVAPER